MAAALAAIAAVTDNYQKLCKFVDERTDLNTCGVPSERGTDIVFSPFYKDAKFAPGNGHDLKSAAPTKDGVPVFQSKAFLETALSRPDSSAPGVTVSALEVKLLEYKPEPIADLNYDFGLANIAGKAIAEKLSYRLTLDGDSVRVRQFLDADQKAEERSRDDLLGNKQITFKAGDAPQALKAIVDVTSNGLYRFVFVARYTAGKGTKLAESQPILVYKHE